MIIILTNNDNNTILIILLNCILVDLLEPLTSDAVDFVRQGALIALSMILIEATKTQEPKVEAIRKLFEDKISDKHEDTMCKFGAIIASGIIDAGGRNVTISLLSR